MGDLLFANKASACRMVAARSARCTCWWLSAPPLPLMAGEAALGHVTSMSSAILGWQVVPYSPTEDLPVQIFTSAGLLPPLPPPSRSLRVSLMDAACASRGEMQMHLIPFFFQARPLAKVQPTLRRITHLPITTLLWSSRTGSMAAPRTRLLPSLWSSPRKGGAHVGYLSDHFRRGAFLVQG